MTRVAVAVSLACTIAVLVGAAGAPAKRVGLIRVFATTMHEVNDGRVHLVVKTVRDKRQRVVGEIGQVCIDLPSDRQECAGTLLMPLGRLTYAGLRRSARFYVLAITGGTGIYVGSTGAYQSTTVAVDPRVEAILVSLVP